MKRIAIILITIIVLGSLLSGCLAETNYEDKLLGKWYFPGEQEDHYILFSSDGSVKQRYGERFMHAFWRIEDDVLILTDADGVEYGRMIITSIDAENFYGIDLTADSKAEEKVHLTRK